MEAVVLTDTFANATPSKSETPTSTVIVPGHDISGTVVACQVWDTQVNICDQLTAGPLMSQS